MFIFVLYFVLFNILFSSKSVFVLSWFLFCVFVLSKLQIYFIQISYCFFLSFIFRSHDDGIQTLISCLH